MSNVTAFLGDEIVAAGPVDEIAPALADRYPAERDKIRFFDDESGRIVDPPVPGTVGERGRGRPKLGVVAREVTLLPRHWDWLSRQRGGASATLRRLVDGASAGGERDPRARQDAVYRFLQETCGDRPGYEEALRALYRGDTDVFADRIAAWPKDVRRYAKRLLA